MITLCRNSRRTPLAVALALLACCPLPASADPIADFYRGRNVNVLIGIAVGASYDREARLIARHLGKQIPGNPNLVPQNMVGAGGMLMASHVYGTAPKDGSTLGMMANTIPMNQAVGLDAARYDADKFLWIGSVLPRVNSAMIARADSPIKSLKDARETESVAGATPRGSFVYTLTSLLNTVVGTKFKIVTGYQGLASVYLAMERGEVDAVAVTWSEFKKDRGPLFTAGKVRVLVQSLPKADDLPNVPVLEEVVTDAADRAVIDLLLSGNLIGRPLATAPGTPADRVAALRAAFLAMCRDPEFVKDATSMGSEIGPITGEAIQAEVTRILATPADVKKRSRAILQ